MSINPHELEFQYYKSQGPGGQNVNKVSTAVRLRFDIQGSMSLTQDVKDQLTHLARNRITEDGILIIEAQRYRTRQQNQKDAISRLEMLVEHAGHPPKRRYPTLPTRSSVENRLKTKRYKSKIKRVRAGEE